MQIGFSTGAFYKYLNIKDAIHFVKQIKCNAIELSLLKMDSTKERFIEQITKEDLDSFEYVSVHAPVLSYGEDDTDNIFRKLSDLNSVHNLDLVIFHPDTVKNFDVFDALPFNVGFENMDNKKDSFKSLDEITSLLDKYSDFKMILDVNHAYTNDKSMKLTSEFCNKLKDRIAEIHISGYDTYHDPIYKTKQDYIIRSIKGLTNPIIIESVLSPKEAKQELDYIISGLH